MALDKTISNLGAEIIKALKVVDEFQKDEGQKIKALQTWQAVHETEAKYISQKIDSVISGVRWILTLVGGALIMAVLNLVII